MAHGVRGSRHVRRHGLGGSGNAQPAQGLKLLVNGLRKGEGVEGRTQEPIEAQARPQTPVASQETIEGGFRRIIAAVDFRSDMDFCFEFEGGLKEVLEVEKFFGIEII